MESEANSGAGGASIQSLQSKSSSSGKKKRTSISFEAQEFKNRQNDKFGDHVWKEDSDAVACPICKKKFSITTRKHHCRNCGDVFCGKCSSYEVVINGSLKRSCLSCYKRVVDEGATDSDMSSASFPSAASSDIDSSLSSRSSGSISQKDGSLDLSDIAPWAESLIHVEYTQQPKRTSTQIFPKESLSSDMIHDIEYLLNKTPVSDKYFTFRIRDKMLKENEKANSVDEEFVQSHKSTAPSKITLSTIFFYCYVYQIKLFETYHSFVLVSRWPFPHIAYRVLSRIYDTYVHGEHSVVDQVKSDRLSVGKEDDLIEQGGIHRLFMTMFGQIMLWPTKQHSVVGEVTVFLPFLGDLISYPFPPNMSLVFSANIPFPLHFWKMNWVSLLGPLGLLQHIWLLWELVSTGQDILVYCTQPSQCCEIIFALASLISPIQYLGDVRPYLVSGDTDVNIIRQSSREKALDSSSPNFLSRSHRRSSKLIGVTDLSLISALDPFHALILVPPAPVETPDNDVVYLGMRDSNMANHFVIGKYSDHNNGEESVVGNKFAPYFEDWFVKMNFSIQQQYLKTKSHQLLRLPISAMILTRSEPASIQDSIMLKKLKFMSSKERKSLGDVLLRDGIRNLTLDFFKPSGDITAYQYDLVEAKKEAESLRKERLEKLALEQRAMEASALVGLDDISEWLRTFPEWFWDSIPSSILIMFYLLLLWLLSLLLSIFGVAPGFPVALLATIVVLKVPMSSHKMAEQLLCSRIPRGVLYPKKFTLQGEYRNPADAAADAAAAAPSSSPMPAADTSSTSSLGSSTKSDFCDLSGVWKRTKCVNYENFVGAQGAGYVQRKLAASVAMVHTITMDSALTVFRLQERGGPIDSDISYPIDNSEMKTVTLKKEFIDRVFYDENNVLTIVKLHLPEKDYELHVKRYLEDNGQSIRLVAKFIDLRKKDNVVETICSFEKQGDSPNSRPETIPAIAKERQSKFGSAVEPAAGSTSSDANSASKSSSSKPDKTVDAVKKPNFSGVWTRVKTENFDSFIGVQGAGYLQRKLAATMPLTHTLTFDASMRAVRLQEKGGPLDLDNSYTIGNPFQESIIVKKKFRDRMSWVGDTLVLHRVADDNTFELVLTRRLESSGNQVQIILNSLHRDLNTMQETEAISWFVRSGDSTSTAPTVDVKEAVTAEDREVMKMNTASEPIAPDAEDSENEEDDDETALAKQRTKSSAHASVFRPTVAVSGFNAHSSHASITRTDFSGVWEKSGGLNGRIASTSRLILRHILTMNPQCIRMEEFINGGKQFDATYVFDGDDVEIEYEKKAFLDHITLEGRDLVLHRTSKDRSHEIIVRRCLESPSKMRVATIVRNLMTGDESESISLFNRIGPSQSTLSLPKNVVLPRHHM